MEDLPNTTEDILDMMREKVRNQAQRLRTLEQYKVLCESRISELSPSHPLPIKHEHLGSPASPDPSSELQQAKAQIERLQKELFSIKTQVPLCENYTLPPPSLDLTFAQLKELYSMLYHQHYKLMQDKKSLEESLRAEIQVSEEQRTYIEVLKQSIEVNSYSGHEFKDTLKTETLKSQDEPQALSKDEYKSEDYKSEELAQSWEDRQKAEKCLKDAAEALQYAEEEVMRLEEVNKELEEANRELEEELNQFRDNENRKKQEVQVLKENYTKALVDLDQANQVIRKLEEEGREFKEKLEKSEKCYEELDTEYKELEKANLELEAKIRKGKEDVEIYHKAALGVEEKLEEAQAEIDSLRLTNYSLQGKVEVMGDSLKEADRKYQGLAGKYDGLELENKENRSLNFSYEVKLKMANESLAAYEKNQKSHERNLEEFRAKNKQMKEIIEVLQNDLRNSNQESEKIKLENMSFREKASNQQKRIHDLESYTDKSMKDWKKTENLCRTEIEQLREQLEKTLADNEKLERLYSDSTTSLEKANSQKSKLSDELTKLKKDHEDSQSSKNYLLITQKTQESSLLSLQTENNSLKCQKKELLSELTQCTQRKIALEEENANLLSLSSHLSLYKSKHDESLRLASIFCSTFGSILLNSSCFSTLVSESFKEILQHNNKVFEICISDWIDAFSNEFESVIRNFANTRDNLAFISSQLQSKVIRLQEVTEEVVIKTDAEQVLRLEIEDYKSEIQKKGLEIEMLAAKGQYVSVEFENCKENLNRLKGDFEKMQETANFASTKILKLKRALDEEMEMRKRNVSELVALQQEKNLLNRVLVRLEKLVAEEDLNVTYEDILRENLNASSKSPMISPVNGKSFSYDFYGRDPVMFE